MLELLEKVFNPETGNRILKWYVTPISGPPRITRVRMEVLIDGKRQMLSGEGDDLEQAVNEAMAPVQPA